MGNFGNYLRERRKEKGISTEYVTLHTALNENVLYALENSNYEFFNSSFYFTNFLKDYLDFLEIDRDRFFSEFSEELEFLNQEAESVVLQSMTGLRYSNFRNRKLIIKAIILGVLIAIFIYLTFINKGLLFSFFESEPVLLPDTAMQITGIPEREPDFSPVRVSLAFTGPCWARALRGGEPAAERVFLPGEVFHIRGYHIRLVIGNPSATEIRINGQRTDKYKKQPGAAILDISPDTVERIISWNP